MRITNRLRMQTAAVLAGAGLFVVLSLQGCSDEPAPEPATNSNEAGFQKTENETSDDHAAAEQTEDNDLEEQQVVDPDTGSSETSDSEQDDTEDTASTLSAWKESHPAVRGIYVTGPVAGDPKMDELISLVDETELNAMVIDIKNDAGEVTYKMEEGTPQELGVCIRYIRDIDALMQELKEHDIYCIARIACFKDGMLAEKKPELALRSSSGKPVTDSNGNAFVNPCSEEVWEYLIEIAEHCADLGFDEIQYDYVRFPVGKEAQEADYGVELTDEDKHRYITNFLTRATTRLHEKGIPVTADLFGTVIGNPVDIAKVGQDYTELSQVVDVLCPMVYPSHYGKGVFGLDVPDAKPYETILGALTLSGDELSKMPEESTAIVRPWLQSFTATWVDGHISYGGTEIRAQIQAVYDAGYNEWILWNAHNNYSKDGLEQTP